MQRYQERQYIPNVPVGVNAVAVGDSITSNVSAGQYIAQLAAKYAWTLLGLTDPVVNGQFETNASGWTATNNCTIAQATDCPGKSFITGSHALKMTATTAAVAYCSCGGDIGGGMSLNMAANVPQTFGVAVWVPGGTTGLTLVEIFDKIGTGAYNQTNSATIDVIGNPGLASSWQTVAAIRTAPVGTTEMFARVTMTAPTAGQSIWIDGAYIAHTNGLVSPAIGGASLATFAACNNPNSILDNFAARVAAFSAPLYLLLAGTNDFFNMTDSAWVGAHGGPLYTPTQWGVAIRSAITQILALSGHPALVVFGMLPANSQVPNMGRLPSYASSGQDLRNQMDAQTRAACLENHVPFVPLWDMPSGYTDGIHPDASLLGTGQLGHTWMAQRFQDVMNRVVR